MAGARRALLQRADAARARPRARDLRAEAAELFETRSTTSRARRALRGRARRGSRATRARATRSRESPSGTAISRSSRRSSRARDARAAREERRGARASSPRSTRTSSTICPRRRGATRRCSRSIRRTSTALKGLDRIYNRTGRYRELLEKLERQVAVAATPRQKINLYERMAALHDEEFLDHAKAASASRRSSRSIRANDARSPRSRVTTARSVTLGRAVKLYEKHAARDHDEPRRVELIVQRARMLAEQIGSPERATKAYEQVLELLAGSRRRARSARAPARDDRRRARRAQRAIEALAAKAATPEAKAEQWMRAAKLLETRGDRDGAIERYKLALEANPQGHRRVGRAARGVRAARRRVERRRRSSSASSQVAEGEPREGAPPRGAREDAAQSAHAGRREGRNVREARDRARRARTPKRSSSSATSRTKRSASSRRARTTSRSSAASARSRRTTASACSCASSRRSASEPRRAARRCRRLAGRSPDLDGRRGTRADGASRRDRDAPAHPARRRRDAAEARAGRRRRRSLARRRSSSSTATRRPRRRCTRSFSRAMRHEHRRDDERAEALYGLGESARRAASSTRRSSRCAKPRTSIPSSPLPLRALARVYEEKGSWERGRPHPSAGASRSRAARSASSSCSRSATSSLQKLSDRGARVEDVRRRARRDGPTIASSSRS